MRLALERLAALVGDRRCGMSEKFDFRTRLLEATRTASPETVKKALRGNKRAIMDLLLRFIPDLETNQKKWKNIHRRGLTKLARDHLASFSPADIVGSLDGKD
jgi:hypothetical protein